MTVERAEPARVEVSEIASETCGSRLPDCTKNDQTGNKQSCERSVGAPFRVERCAHSVTPFERHHIDHACFTPVNQMLNNVTQWIRVRVKIQKGLVLREPEEDQMKSVSLQVMYRCISLTHDKVGLHMSRNCHSSDPSSTLSLRSSGSSSGSKVSHGWKRTGGLRRIRENSGGGLCF